MPLTMLLPVLLTDAEKVHVLGEMSTKLTALEVEKAAKKAATADYNERIKNLEGSIHGLNESIKSNTVDREVEISREPNPFSGKAKIFRLDRTPPEFVKEVEMDDDEAQMRIGEAAIPGRGTNLADHRTEEQEAAGSPEEAEEMRAQRLAAEREERVALLAAELTERAMVVQLPTVDGATLQFAGTIVTGEAPMAVTYEQIRETADEARAAVARNAAEHITAMQEEAETKARAAAAPAAPDPIDAIMEKLAERIVLEEKPGGKFLAHIDGAIEGLPGRQGFSGPIRATAKETTDEMLAGLRQLLQDNRPWVEAIEVSKQNEINRLAADQQADDTATKKRLLKVPAGAKSKRKLKVTDDKGGTLAEGGDGPDVTPPAGAAF